jgi:serine/threonine protein kinase
VALQTTISLVERFDCDLTRFLFSDATGIRRLAWPDERRVPWLLLVSLLRDVLCALVHLRRFGRVHHDLKPDNILVSKHPPVTSSVTITYPGDPEPRALPRAVVADFGHMVRAPTAAGSLGAVPELDLHAVVDAESGMDAARIGREYSALVDAAFEWTFAPHAGTAGNAGHLSPEVQASFSAAAEARRPYVKQGAYEAGVLMFELLSPTGRIPPARSPPPLSYADTRVAVSAAEVKADVEVVCIAASGLASERAADRLPLEAAYAVVEWAWAREVRRRAQ